MGIIKSWLNHTVLDATVGMLILVVGFALGYDCGRPGVVRADDEPIRAGFAPITLSRTPEPGVCHGDEAVIHIMPDCDDGRHLEIVLGKGGQVYWREAPKGE